MRNLHLYIAYDGSNYHGFQVQKNAITITEVFQDALEKLTGVRSDIKGCSRTDSGVHARDYGLSFMTDSKIKPENIVSGLNRFLPEDIVVKSCREMPEDFHGRYNVISKEYVYRILNTRQRSPFEVKKSFHYYWDLDVEKMSAAAKYIEGTHDFSAFCSDEGTGDNRRTVYSCTVTRVGDFVEVKVSADGFLYNMVRIIVGTLLRVSQGKIQPEDIPKILESKDREKAGPTARPYGLYLNKVNYDK